MNEQTKRTNKKKKTNEQTNLNTIGPSPSVGGVINK